MNERADRKFLTGVAAAMGFSALLFLVHPPEIGWAPLPSDPRSLAERISRHPADWAAASALTEVALDLHSANRVELWRSAYNEASLLAPDRPDPAKAFARAAFFHWPELTANEKHDALAAFTPLLRDPDTFNLMAKPLFELTGDLALLHRSHPANQSALSVLISLALPNGFFADYRTLRQELVRRRIDDFAARRGAATTVGLIEALPEPPYHADAEPLIVALLQELHRRPLDDNPNRGNVIDGIVDYALRHNLGPLDGLEIITRKAGAASIDTRIELARNLGLNNLALQLQMASNDPRRVKVPDSEWHGLCDNDVCSRSWRTVEAFHAVALRIETVQTDNVPAYTEIYVDDALRAEGEVGPARDFILAVGNPGTHRIEVVLTNPLTRNGFPRRLHVASLTTL